MSELALPSNQSKQQQLMQEAHLDDMSAANAITAGIYQPGPNGIPMLRQPFNQQQQHDAVALGMCDDVSPVLSSQPASTSTTNRTLASKPATITPPTTAPPFSLTQHNVPSTTHQHPASNTTMMATTPAPSTTTAGSMIIQDPQTYQVQLETPRLGLQPMTMALSELNLNKK
jgi:hypothetical protein